MTLTTSGLFVADSPLNRIPDYSFTLSKRPAAFPSGVWGQAVSGNGPYVYTQDGRKLLDWICALGALTVGHAHPHVSVAIARQLQRGTIFSLPSVWEGQLSERLCSVIPCAKQVRVVKTGSEACSAAVRIARMATGRSVVLTTDTSYHGWHDWHAVTKAAHAGIPEGMEQYVRTFRYNDIESFWDAVESCSDYGGVAAVMLEPVQGESPRNNFLRQLADQTRALGAVLIFDEMLCGGRLALGGAQSYYAIVPDLATFGKALGGGLPFAFVCGSRDLMRHAWPVSGTFSGDALSLAAADAMLDIYADPDFPVIEVLWRNGRIVQEALAQAARRYDVPFTMHGHAPRFWLDFGPDVDKRLALSCFSQQAARRGQLVHPAVMFMTSAMTTQQVTEGASALADALDAVCACLKSDGNAGLRALLVGEPYADSVR